MIGVIRDKRNHLKQQLHDLEGMMLDLRDSEEKCLQALTEQSLDTSAKSKTGT